MHKIQLRSQVGSDGILHLDVPVGLTDTELEVTVTVKPVLSEAPNTPKGKGYPLGFFEETFGCFKDESLIVDSEGEFEERELLQ